MAKVVIDKERCKSCGLCIKFCNKKCLEYSKSFNRSGHHPVAFKNDKQCTACGTCYIMCPDVAVEVWK